jgi:hypothetical protein
MELDIFNHKDIPLYVVDLPYSINRTYKIYYTRIPWGEYKRIRFAEKVGSLSPWDLKVKIFRDYSVRDPSWSDFEIEVLPAGIVDTVANLIMYVSDSGIIPDSQGNIDVDSFTNRLNLYRLISSSNVEYQMYTIICLVFKAYTFEMLDRLPFDRIASLFASAERYLIENNVLKSQLEIYDPRKAKEEKTITPVKTNAQKGSEEATILMDLLRIRNAENESSSEEIPASKPEVKKQNEVPSTAKRFESLTPSSILPDEDRPKPQAKSLTEELLEIRNAKAKSAASTYIPPKDSAVLANGIQMAVPGIQINKSNSTGGFDPEDFQGPFLTEEEALAMQYEMGIFPAGHEIIEARKEQEREQEEIKIKEEVPFGKKRKFKKKL